MEGLIIIVRMMEGCVSISSQGYVHNMIVSIFIVYGYSLMLLQLTHHLDECYGYCDTVLSLCMHAVHIVRLAS